MQKSSGKEIYWEKQGQDQLCGVHCLNSLLQGPFFNEIELANIALELDQEERNLLSGGSNNQKELVNLMKGGSNNVADDGNYSIQVLSSALKKVGELVVESVDKQLNRNEDLSNEQGFICNSSDHWFAIRKVDNTYYNLNSLNKTGPQIVSDFYLSAFLIGVKQDGYTIFVVKGVYPDNAKHLFPFFQNFQQYFTKEKVQQLMQQNKNGKLNMGGADEDDIEKAIQESLKDQKQREEGTSDFMSSKQEKDKFQAFTGQGVSLNKGSSSNEQKIDYSNMYLDAKDDPEFAMVVKSSLQEKFQIEPAQGITISFRRYDGAQFQWRFGANSRIEDLYDFALFKLGDSPIIPFLIQTNYPKKVLSNMWASLQEEGIDDMTSVFIIKQ